MKLMFRSRPNRRPKRVSDHRRRARFFSALRPSFVRVSQGHTLAPPSARIMASVLECASKTCHIPARPMHIFVSVPTSLNEQQQVAPVKLGVRARLATFPTLFSTLPCLKTCHENPPVYILLCLRACADNAHAHHLLVSCWTYQNIKNTKCMQLHAQKGCH